MTETDAGYIHANALALGEKGLLLRGASGSGKSALTLSLIARFQAQGDFARLVGDDRVRIEARGGRLIARPHPAIAGMIEIRGLGLAPLPFEKACVLRAIVDIAEPGAPPPRLPQETENTAILKGIALPRLHVQGCDEASLSRIIFLVQSIKTI